MDKKAKIMLVDDTKLILELEKSFLKFSDVDVVTAANGIEALELVRKDPPDLIFMDLNMPGMDGVACCTFLKADPFLCGIPVVMITTDGNDADRERAKAAGCDGFLTKPIDRHLFLDMARRYTDTVERRDMRRPCQFPVLFLAGNATAGAHALDVSDGGMYLACREPVDLDAKVTLAFYLETPQLPFVEVSGRVAWVNEDGNRVHKGLPCGFGVEFSGLEEWQSTELKNFVGVRAAG